MRNGTLRFEIFFSPKVPCPYSRGVSSDMFFPLLNRTSAEITRRQIALNTFWFRQYWKENTGIDGPSGQVG
jgi:hypothetical protein